MNGFRKLPTGWCRDRKLKNFKGGEHAGESIAALKVLMSVAILKHEFHEDDVAISYSKFEEVCGLSNPSISKGIKKLEQEEILEVDRTGNTNKYRFKDNEDDKWSKVPFNLVHKKLREISNRKLSSLSALKIYITLLTLRDNKQKEVRISYEKLRDWTGLQSTHIRPGLDILFSHSIIHIQKSEELDIENVRKPHNVYKIMGNLMLKGS